MRFFSAFLSIILTAAASSVVGAGEADDMNARRKTMTEVIQHVGDIHKHSIHQWFRDASRLLGKKFTGVPFGEAVKVAEDLKLPLIEGWENGSAIHRRFRLADSVFALRDGKTLDAYLFFSSFNKKDGKFPFVATDVYKASIGLVIDVGVPYEAVVAREIFPTNTALQKALSLPAVAESGGPWPFLERVTISYDLLFDRWVTNHPSGFRVDIDFVASRTKQIARKTIGCIITSGLDPLRDSDGNPTQKNHEPKDVLGEPQSRGGSEVWHGEDAEILLNKRSFLRPSSK